MLDLVQLKRTFTLVELMIVVAIIAILAAVGITSFADYQYRAKTAEVFTNVRGIMTAQIGYNASYDGYVSTPEWPRAFSALDKKPVAWTTGSSFDTIGWSSDGDVRGAYACTTNYSFGLSLACTGAIDPDGDGYAHGAGAIYVDAFALHTQPEPSLLDIILPSAHAFSRHSGVKDLGDSSPVTGLDASVYYEILSMIPTCTECWGS